MTAVKNDKSVRATVVYYECLSVAAYECNATVRYLLLTHCCFVLTLILSLSNSGICIPVNRIIGNVDISQCCTKI